MIYWTKPKVEYDEELEMFISIGGLEEIKESDSDFVEDGSGFEIDMNGISYENYLANTENYTIENGKLIEK